MGTALALSNGVIDDPLAYLPRKDVETFQRGQVIFSETDRANRIYLVIQGLVTGTIQFDGPGQLLMCISATDDFFGEAGLLDMPARHMQAQALEDTSVMSWSADEIEREVARQPRLGLAMTQVLTSMCVELQERLQGLALDKTPERVVWALIHLSKKLGVQQEDGSYQILRLTHETIADYIGTSREIVTCNMNLLRDKALISYGRRSINVHRQALIDHLSHRRMVQSGLIRE